jgi:hypothetical protein
MQARRRLERARVHVNGCNLTAQDECRALPGADGQEHDVARVAGQAIDCTMGPIAGRLADRRLPADDGRRHADAGPAWTLTGLRFQEYKSLDPTGAPLDVSQRIPEAVQLSDSEAAQLRDVTYVFGGWNPKAAAGDAGTD